MPLQPPHLANWLLRRALLPHRYETISGDLEEMYRLDVVPRVGRRGARSWYWRQVLSIVAAGWFRTSPRVPVQPRLSGRDHMTSLWHDARYATRALLEARGFTALAVLTLALGVGGTTAIFAVVHGLLLKPLPFHAPSQLMLVHLLSPDRESPAVYREMVWSYPKYRVFRASQRAFVDSALFTPEEWSLTGGTEPERLHGEIIDSHYLPVLGIAPSLGRGVRPEEDRTPRVANVVLIGHGLWQRRFGADPEIIGHSINLNLVPHTVIGVLPVGFTGLTGDAQLWVPLMASSNEGYLVDLDNPGSHSYYLVARRRASMSEAQAQAEVRLLGSRVDAAFPQRAGKRAYSAAAVSLDDSRTGALMRRAVMTLLGAVVAVLLIGGVNVAHLVLARSLTRQREVAIRLAIGATRARVIRLFLIESLLLACAAAALGIAVAYGAMHVAATIAPEAGIILTPDAPLLTQVGIGMIGLDSVTVAFALGTAIFTALLVGLIPAWQASRADVTHAIKAGGTGSIARGGRGVGLRTLLMVAENALALVLLAAAAVMLQSVHNLQSTGLGFEPDGLTSFRIALPDAQYDRPHSTLFLSDLLERVRAQAGVQAASFVSCAPLSGGCNSTTASFPDRPPVARGTEPSIAVFWASPGYFQTMGIRLIRGRFFTDRDRDQAPRVVIVGETAARKLWPGEDPIGRRIALGQGGFHEGNGAEVIGVVNDVRYQAVEAAPRADAYIPVLQSPRRSGLLFVRTAIDPSTLIPVIREQIRAIDPNLPVSDVKTMGIRFNDATWQTRLSADLLAVFAGLALLLAAIGLYGVMAQGVEQRRREIGVRMALGADHHTIVRLVLGRALSVALGGIAVGVLLSLLLLRQLDVLLYHVSPNDPTLFVTLAVVLVVVTLLASYVPARRASRVDPLTSLRTE